MASRWRPLSPFFPLALSPLPVLFSYILLSFPHLLYLSSSGSSPCVPPSRSWRPVYVYSLITPLVSHLPRPFVFPGHLVLFLFCLYTFKIFSFSLSLSLSLIYLSPSFPVPSTTTPLLCSLFLSFGLSMCKAMLILGSNEFTH